jgi:NADH:ubiquinone oxidoreductase subunit 6 (subunit J)
MNTEALFFWILAILTGLCAILVVVTQNIVRSAAYLLFTLGGVAGVFFLLGADFVGATQLIVYVGGVLILVVFGVMLTAQGPFITMKTSPAEWGVALVVGLLLFGVLAVSLTTATWPRASPGASENPATSRSAVTLGEGFLGIGVGPQQSHNADGTPVRGAKPRTSYLLPFEIVSVHLVVVLIGAAYLARAKRRRGATS